MAKTFYIPDLGEAEFANVVEVLVKVGDIVTLEQPLAILEGDKATMELPAEAAGVISAINLQVGDKVAAGDEFVSITVENSTQQTTVVKPEVAKAEGVEVATIDMLVPDLGEAEFASVVEVLVKVGDIVTLEQPLAILEGDKATMELPAEAAGVISAINLQVGDKVSAGDEFVSIKVENSTQQTTVVKPEVAKAEDVEVATIDMLVPDLGEAEFANVVEVLVKVGDIVTLEQPLAILEGDKATMELPAEAAGVISAINLQVGDKVAAGDIIASLEKQKTKPELTVEMPTKVSTEKKEKTTFVVNSSSVYASPSVRKLARQLGVDLSKVQPSGKKARITKLDVKSFVKSVLTQKPSVGGFEIAPWPKLDPKDLGDVTIVPLSNIKQVSGSFLHRNWVKIPHVTQFEQADITELESWRKENKEAALELGCKISPLILVVKAVVEVLKLYPIFNSSLSSDGKSLIQKNYYNIGVAVDSPNGLLVPVIKDVDQKSIIDLAKEIASVAKQAREKGLSAQQMRNSTFTISSLGGIGGTYFTPIVNAPDVAILGLSRSELQPKYIDNNLQPRLMLPLSLSYDHRVIDGADGARFMVELTKQLAKLHLKFKLTECVIGEINE